MNIKEIFFEESTGIKHPSKGRFTGLALTAPILLGTAVFFLLPLCITAYYSMTFGIGGAQFVGVDNYITVLQSERFRLASYNTLRFLYTGVPAIMALSLALALVLRRKLFGTSLFRNALLFPMVVPVAGIVMLLQVFFADKGVINGVLNNIGADKIGFFNSPSAFWILIGLYLWKNCGYNVILFLAGLAMIPTELYQTADIEGANALQKFRYITLPLLLPTMFFVAVLSIINSFKSYREAFLLGGKHPHDSIYFIQHFLNNNFENLNYQRLSVAAMILFACIFVLIAVLYYCQEKWGEGTSL